VLAASPALAQERPVGAFRATGIDHVQITVSDLKATQQFYEKLFGVTSRSTGPTQLSLAIGTAGDSVSVHSESGPIKPIDHFGITVENFSADAAMATIRARGPWHESPETRRIGLYDWPRGSPRPTGSRQEIVTSTNKRFGTRATYICVRFATS
jgi:extradiol dioxygenase family protein